MLIYFYCMPKQVCIYLLAKIYFLQKIYFLTKIRFLRF
jgi:hypothetical protein